MVDFQSLFIRKKDAGEPPGTITVDSNETYLKPIISIIKYNAKEVDSANCEDIEEAQKYIEEGFTTWINIDGIGDAEFLKKLGNAFNIHSLILEDIANLNQLPKIDDMDDYLYVIVKMLTYNQEKNDFTQEQISFILGENFVLSIQEIPGDIFGLIRSRIFTGKGRIRKRQAAYLLHCIIDVIVDYYFVVLEKLGAAAEEYEQLMLNDPSQELLINIQGLRQRVTVVRRYAWPLKEVINSLLKSESDLIEESNEIYIRNLYDHSLQIVNSVEILRDLVSSTVDIYHSSVANRMNEVMKILTIITTIFIPLTFICSIYGMNFRYMPEIESPWGYPAVLVLMLLLGLGMLAYFKNKKWL